jgi:hypothetical protein
MKFLVICTVGILFEVSVAQILPFAVQTNTTSEKIVGGQVSLDFKPQKQLGRFSIFRKSDFIERSTISSFDGVQWEA